MVTIFCDGAAEPTNPGPGGWAVVILDGSDRKELSGGFRWSTNQRMELFSLVVGLRTLEEPCELAIVSDSRYLIDALSKGWLDKWRSNGWRTKEHSAVKNQDLWTEIDQLLAIHQPRCRWIKGHTGGTSRDATENARCDSLANQAARGEYKTLSIDIEYEKVSGSRLASGVANRPKSDLEKAINPPVGSPATEPERLILFEGDFYTKQELAVLQKSRAISKRITGRRVSNHRLIVFRG